MNPVRIVFTGHRNREVDPVFFDALAAEFPGAQWVHGGAVDGFDDQVEEWWSLLGRARGLPEPERYLPNYGRYGVRAPLIRNQEMVDSGPQLVIGCWDGRTIGGTFFTLKAAARAKIPIRTWPPV